MSKSNRMQFAGGLLMAALLAVAWPAHAAILLEYDFNTASVGSDVAASQSVASAVGSLVGTDGNPGTAGMATVNTGTAVGSPLVYAPSIATGSLDMTGNFGSKQGVVTKDTDPSASNNNYWANFYGGNYGTGSAVVVFKPNFTTHGRAGLLSSNANGGGGFWLLDSDDTLGPRLIMGGVDINVGNVGAWDINAWYVLAASWTNGGQARLFMKAFLPGASLYTAAGGTATTGGANMLNPIAIGNRNGPGSSGESFNGRIALVQFSDQYLDSSSFTTVYNQLVPEPASMSLLAFAGLALIRRKR